MKLSKSLVAVLIIVFDILAVFVVVPGLITGNEEYNEKLAQAREYYGMGLCEKSMQAYEEAAEISESLELKLEMANVYYTGFNNGEFTSYYRFSNFLFEITDAYYKQAEAYDVVLEYFYEFEDYENCITLIYQAENLGMDSETISKIRNEIRYLCETNYATYEEVVLAPENTFLIKDEKYRFLNEKVGSLSSSKYDYATPMINGYALIKENDTVMLVSSDFVREAYFPSSVTEATGVGNGLIACKIDDTYAYYDLNGNLLFGNYIFAGRFVNGVAAVQTDAGWSIIDTEGKAISNVIFQDIKLSQSNSCAQAGVIFAKIDDAYYMYNCNMEKLSEMAFEDTDVFTSTNGYAACKINGKWGFVGMDGELLIEPQYEDARSFSNGLAGVKNGEYWSFIDMTNETVISGDFTDVSYFNNKGYCFVKNETYWYYLRRYYMEN